ncbi:MAG: plastocyanin/azurin family copper-binding protein, partial [Thermoleophilaceae bacterium]
AGTGKPKEAGTEPPGTVLKLAVETKPGQITFDKKRLTAPAGRIGIELANSTELGHNVRIQTGKRCCFAPGHKDLGGTTTGVGKIRGTVNLKPGRYFYLCSVGGHWQLGQRGKLVVK